MATVMSWVSHQTAESYGKNSVDDLSRPNAISNAKFRSRSHDAVIRVYDEAGNVIETHAHADDFKEPRRSRFAISSKTKAATR
jgi:hypothetical protein